MLVRWLGLHLLLAHSSRTGARTVSPVKGTQANPPESLEKGKICPFAGLTWRKAT